MAFTREDWEQQAAKQYQKLNKLASWLRQQTKPVGIVAYSSLATFTIWPLVEAVATAAAMGNPLPVPVLTAVGAIMGGVGGNLLANQVQSWYDDARDGKPPSQNDVLAWIRRNVSQKEELRTEIDRVLEQLQAIPQAQAAVQAENWVVLVEELREDMKRLGNLPRFEAHLQGDGIIAQGENIKIAKDNSLIVERDLHGDVVMSKTVNQITDPTQMEPDTLREAYLNRLLDERNQLLLGGIDPKAATNDDERLALSAVYTALLTESSQHLDEMTPTLARAEKQPRRLSALEQLNQNRHLVLLGDPGNGKSTFVNFVAVCLAGEALGKKQLNLYFAH